MMGYGIVPSEAQRFMLGIRPWHGAGVGTIITSRGRRGLGTGGGEIGAGSGGRRGGRRSHRGYDFRHGALPVRHRHRTGRHHRVE